MDGWMAYAEKQMETHMQTHVYIYIHIRHITYLHCIFKHDVFLCLCCSSIHVLLLQVDDLLVISEFAEESFLGEWNSSRSALDPLAGLPGMNGLFWRI